AVRATPDWRAVTFEASDAVPLVIEPQDRLYARRSVRTRLEVCRSHQARGSNHVATTGLFGADGAGGCGHVTGSGSAVTAESAAALAARGAVDGRGTGRAEGQDWFRFGRSRTAERRRRPSLLRNGEFVARTTPGAASGTFERRGRILEPRRRVLEAAQP